MWFESKKDNIVSLEHGDETLFWCWDVCDNLVIVNISSDKEIDQIQVLVFYFMPSTLI